MNGNTACVTFPRQRATAAHHQQNGLPQASTLRRKEEFVMYQRILLPTDGSPYSEAALPQGIQLARQFAVPVVLLHALDEALLPCWRPIL